MVELHFYSGSDESVYSETLPPRSQKGCNEAGSGFLSAGSSLGVGRLSLLVDERVKQGLLRQRLGSSAGFICSVQQEGEVD